MEFEEHKQLKEFNLKIMEKRFKRKLQFVKELHALKLNILKTMESISDKRHNQIMERMKTDYEFFEKKTGLK